MKTNLARPHWNWTRTPNCIVFAHRHPAARNDDWNGVKTSKRLHFCVFFPNQKNNCVLCPRVLEVSISTIFFYSVSASSLRHLFSIRYASMANDADVVTNSFHVKMQRKFQTRDGKYFVKNSFPFSLRNCRANVCGKEYFIQFHFLCLIVTHWETSEIKVERELSWWHNDDFARIEEYVLSQSHISITTYHWLAKC